MRRNWIGVCWEQRTFSIVKGIPEGLENGRQEGGQRWCRSISSDGPRCHLVAEQVKRGHKGTARLQEGTRELADHRLQGGLPGDHGPPPSEV